ncbi:hypothetical protein CDAR_237951 [Caerostris darwini]|uniref:Uncharacterized protein n=1 Tax=Caerostris darwini TaxID=1538125 RepID=A0AAV4S4R9_9ARAC|nr:hypothetical protein CDAR_237951 [Caerostris darwini]
MTFRYHKCSTEYAIFIENRMETLDSLGEESSNYDVCKPNDSTLPKHGSRLLQGLFATLGRIPARHGTPFRERGIIFK